MLQVFIIMLYENVSQNPELFPTQVSLFPEKSALGGTTDFGRNSITPGDWDKPLKLWGTLGQWPHTKLSPTNKQTNKQTNKLAKFENLTLKKKII
jgi:hypothetical protein